MLSKKKEGDRFAKVLAKLQAEKTEKSEQPKLPSAQKSFLQDYIIQSDKSTKYGNQIETTSTIQMDEAQAVNCLMASPEVLINKQVAKLKTEIVPTSNGMRFIVFVGTKMINLSWLHSVKQLQPGKILMLYFDLRDLGEGKAKMQSLILQMGKPQGSILFSALSWFHGRYHDEEVQKLFHSLC